MPEIGGPQGSCRRDRRLADPSFSGDEKDPHPPASSISSARRRSPRSAAWTICFSACRLRNPGTTKAGSTRSA
jgi:hypothetical protein